MRCAARVRAGCAQHACTSPHTHPGAPCGAARACAGPLAHHHDMPPCPPRTHQHRPSHQGRGGGLLLQGLGQQLHRGWRGSGTGGSPGVCLLHTSASDAGAALAAAPTTHRLQAAARTECKKQAHRHFPRDCESPAAAEPVAAHSTHTGSAVQCRTAAERGACRRGGRGAAGAASPPAVAANSTSTTRHRPPCRSGSCAVGAGGVLHWRKAAGLHRLQQLARPCLLPCLRLHRSLHGGHEVAGLPAAHQHGELPHPKL